MNKNQILFISTLGILSIYIFFLINNPNQFQLIDSEIEYKTDPISGVSSTSLILFVNTLTMPTIIILLMFVLSQKINGKKESFSYLGIFMSSFFLSVILFILILVKLGDL